MGYKENIIKKQHRLFWGSSYDRGLDSLLFMWPDILEKYPDAELHICYGWDLFDKAFFNNPERMRWKESLVTMMRQSGIYEHGRLSKQQLEEIRQTCGIWAYPTYFTEIDCITAKEAQKDGLVPVAVKLAALEETVRSGKLIDGDIKDPKVQQEFLNALLEVMGWDKDTYIDEVEKAKQSVNKVSWKGSADAWSKEFLNPPFTPMVSICTPTIRTGFWNIMADNISKQTYKNIEWIIIDDYGKDRRAIAEKYAAKYSLNIKYIRGEKVSKYYPHDYGLVAANNKAWKSAEGELLVWLQDFVLMPEDGIEKLVSLYNHNPNALIAPTDISYNVEEEFNKENLEDWWDGNTNLTLQQTWRNPRNMFLGVRPSDNHFDFEMNYAAIPKHILDTLNGWYQFMDDGLGYDNVDLAYRALLKGYTLLVDDTNVAKCINIWPIVGGTGENIINRERQLNPPRFGWLVKQLRLGRLPIVRDPIIDERIKLEYAIPENITDEECSRWIIEHTEEIMQKWEDL